MLQRLRLYQRLTALFPERHLYLRSGGEMRAFVITQKQQMLAAGGVTAAALWMGVCTAAMLINLVQGAVAPPALAQAAAGPNWIAARQSDVAALASAIEQRHQALAMLLSHGRPAALPDGGDPVSRLQAVEASQEQLLQQTERLANERAARLRKGLAMAGVHPAVEAVKQPVSLPLSAVSQADLDFAAGVEKTAAELSEVEALTRTAHQLPLARPTAVSEQSSGFGARRDPFTRHLAFHPGLDFTGQRMTPVLATAPGVVAFTGVKTGYGNTVEVNHGKGFVTRYAHLASIGVRAGQRVERGARLGGMGSTGRSTGTHLHYEVWVNGRVQNPERFVRAGAFVMSGVG